MSVKKHPFTKSLSLMSINLVLLVSTLFSPALYAADEAVEYTLTRQYGSVFFHVMYEGYLTMVGRFDDYEATLTLNPADLSQSQLEASVSMGSLNMADSDVAETLVNSSAWFNSNLFPSATFSSSSVTVTSDTSADFEGELTFMGISKPWTMQIEFFGGSDGELTGRTVGMKATGTFDRLDFGLDQYRNLAADEVTIEVNAKFNRN